MRLIIDSNIFVGPLLSQRSASERMLSHWREEHFTLLCCEEQIDELRRVTHYPKIRERLPAARMIDFDEVHYRHMRLGRRCVDFERLEFYHVPLPPT